MNRDHINTELNTLRPLPELLQIKILSCSSLPRAKSPVQPGMPTSACPSPWFLLPLSLSLSAYPESRSSMVSRREALGVLRIRLDCSFKLLEKTHHLPVHVKTGPETHQAHDLLLNRVSGHLGREDVARSRPVSAGERARPRTTVPSGPVSLLCLPHASPPRPRSSRGPSNHPWRQVPAPMLFKAIRHIPRTGLLTNSLLAFSHASGKGGNVTSFGGLWVPTQGIGDCGKCRPLQAHLKRIPYF